MSKRNNKEKDDALRKRLAKLRFKRVVRVALANNHWIADTDEQGLTLNVKKNVAMLIRKKHKTGILTMAQKGLLATPHYTRSIAERKQLCAIVAALDCFTQVPPVIRARLVGHLHFMLVRSGRTLMKEGDVPAVIYFVVSGGIEMSKRIFNKATRKFEQKPMVFLGPGDWIGEVELLENDTRMNTYVATSNSEILVLDEFDFNALLKPYVKKVWLEKKKAIASLSYLKYMTKSQIVSACKFGILRQYNPLETIYPDDKDNTHAHFVLSGECVLLQCLRMKITNPKGEIHYDLIDMVDEDSDNSDDDERGESFDVGELLRSNSDMDEELKNKKKKRKVEFARIVANCKLMNQKPEPVVEQPPVPHHHHRNHRSRSITAQIQKGEEARTEQYEDYYHCFLSDNDDDDDDDDDLIKSRESFLPLTHSKAERLDDLSEVESEGSEIFTAKSASSSSSSSAGSISAKKPKVHYGNYSTRFIDVGSMSFGGLFGVGEKGEHRVVMARTTVQCLLLPLFWLMEEDQNPGHIWQRMRFYLERCIPTRETLFQDFIKSRKWAQFKDDCVKQITHSTTNPTKIEDVPIVIRIVEAKHTDADLHDQ